MSTFYTTFAAVALLLIAYNSRYSGRKMKSFFYFLITLLLLCVAGLRYCVGTDYTQYAYNYEFYKDGSLAILSQLAPTIIARIAMIIHDDYATWFFLMSIITILPVMKTIREESVCVWLSVIMYILLCCWHMPFNIVKQGVSASIIFTGYPFLRDRQPLKWCAVCLLGAIFHVSALLMIPVYFLVTARISFKRVLLILFTGTVIWFSYDNLFALIEFLKQGVGVLSEQSKLRTNDVNILRILVHCVPVLMYVPFYERYRRQGEDFACLFNLSLLNAVLNIASMSSIYLNRFCLYTNIFNVLYIPQLFQPIKRKRSTFLILPITLGLYFIFWAYDLYKCADTVVYQWIFER